MIALVIVRKKSSHEHAFNSEIEMFESPDLTVRFLFVRLDEVRSLQYKDGYVRQFDRSHFECC